MDQELYKFANSIEVCVKTVQGKLIEKIEKYNKVMRQNLTKKDLINSIYMQLGYSKKLIENIIEDIFELILNGLKKKGKVKITNFGTFILRYKKSRIGRNPKTKKEALITERNVIIFKPSKFLKIK